VKIGAHLPQWGPGADAIGVRDVAQAVEASGLDSVWVADHVAIPLQSASRYPYRNDGAPFDPNDGFLDALTTLAVVAGMTRRVQLGTSVMVLPMREPLSTAKAVATLDVLSGGRTLIAIGSGWCKEEFEALGQHFETRGGRMDEQIDILRDAWTAGTVSREGTYFHFPAVACNPLPVQPGGPALLIGGMGPAALRRAATRGNGWHAVGADIEALAAGRRQLAAYARSVGRDPATITTSTSAGLSRDLDRAISRVQALASAGVDHLVLNFPGGPDAVIERVGWVADSVLPEIRAGRSAS
jgi:probable F420-dependent oxidoreductase